MFPVMVIRQHRVLPHPLVLLLLNVEQESMDYQLHWPGTFRTAPARSDNSRGFSPEYIRDWGICYQESPGHGDVICR
jgi:hypothetical protein